ncbi:MAG: hypothetical protein COT09_05840 [Candidatus Hydromicrobium americanum]|nr:MAG: hypothetical protein COT09_05840 [Candidatus Hydromicrobium americanum]
MIKITRKIFLILTIITIIIVLFNLLACRRLGDSAKDLETFEVTRGDIIQTVNTSGYIDSSEQNDYSLPVSGKILYALNKDDVFSKGDVLIEIDNSKQELFITQAEENLNLAKNSLALAKISYQQALDANHIALQLAETSIQQAELSAYNSLIALENANNMANKSKESAKVALENAKKLLAQAQSDPLITDTQLAQYEANVNSARAGYESAVAQGRSSAESAEGTYNQSILGQSTNYWSNLSSTQSAASQIEAAAKNIGQAEIQLKLSEVNLELAKLDIDSSIIYAPYDGIVLSSSYKEGQYASPGVPAISIISSYFIIKAEVNETDVVNLKVGQDVDIRLDAYYENKFSGKIIKISPISTNIGGVVSFELIVKPDIENGPKLLYGLSASLDITASSVENVLYVPIQSVFEEDGKSYVSIPGEDGSIIKTEIITGVFNYDFIEIKSGLNEGDIILISPIR